MIRKSLIQDIPDLLSLINGYAQQEIMLPRTEFEMAESIRDFVVAEDDGRLIGCAALHYYTPTSAEIRSLAVAASHHHRGVGRELVLNLQNEADLNGISSMFAFTYVPEFFRTLGFDAVDRGELPLKAWKDCLRCPKFHACDEIAMLKWLRPAPAPILLPSRPSSPVLQIEEIPRLPILRK